MSNIQSGVLSLFLVDAGSYLAKATTSYPAAGVVRVVVVNSAEEVAVAVVFLCRVFSRRRTRLRVATIANNGHSSPDALSAQPRSRISGKCILQLIDIFSLSLSVSFP